MKTLLMTVLAFLFASLSAHLVTDKPIEHIQPDGTKLSLFVSGDEYYHRVHDKDGYTILKDPQTGYAVYAIPDGETIKASTYKVGEVDPAGLNISPNLILKNPAAKARRDQTWQSITSGNRAPNPGSFNNIVCFIRFDGESEFPNDETFAYYANKFNSYTEESLREYYEEVSLNRLHITSYLYPAADTDGTVVSIQVDNDRGWYQPYSFPDNQLGYTTDGIGQSRLWFLINEVVSELDGLVPGTIDTDLDNPANDVMDALVLVIRGEADNWGNILWPAYWSFDLNCGEINTADVLHCILTFQDDDWGEYDASVVLHEMGHNIGFPDLYHYSSESSMPGISPCRWWDQMNSANSQHSLCYLKWKYGHWISSITEITPTATPTVYDIAAVTPANPYPCYKVASTNPNQFYMIEYRKDTGRYENGIPGSGLIVYRINTACGDGNHDGPPDEVYVYRPGGVVNTNGEPDWAAFSADSSRTSFHNFTDPKPWLWVNDSTTPDGNLIITNISATGGDTMQFTLQNFIPYIWDGSSSTSWNTASNWSQNAVPGPTDYVEIPAGCPRWPYITSTNPGSCYHLTVKGGAYLTIYDGTLAVANDYENNGTLTMNNSSGVLNVDRDLKFNIGSICNVTAAANIYVQRYVEFHIGSSINMGTGILTLDGSIHGYIRTYAPTSIYRLRSDKNDGFASGIGSNSTAVLTIMENIYVLAGSTFNHYYAGTTILQGSFYIYDGAIMNFNQGTLSMEGNVNKTIHIVNISNDLNNLVINKASGHGVTLSYPIQIYANLTIQSGYISPGTNSISIRGNWINNVGSGGFIEGSGTVVVNGGLDQTFSTETFNILELSKTGGALLVPTGSTIYCNSYNWTAGDLSVTGGTFSVVDLTDPGIYGTVTLSSGLIEFQQDSYQYCDLYGTLTISGGTFKVYGTQGVNFLSGDGNGVLNMSGGILDYVHQSLSVSASYIFTENITGGTIRTSRNFSVYRTDFHPVGGTIELYGSTDATLHMTTSPGSNFYNVTINKSAGRGESRQDILTWNTDREDFNNLPTRANTITGSGLLDINGNFRIEAGTFIAPDYIKLAGNWTNLAGPEYFTQGTGSQTVEFNGIGYQYCNYPEVFNIIMLNKSASSLRVNQAGADLQCNTYTWAQGKIQVFYGAFTAWDLSQDGIYGNYEVDTGGTINLYQGTGALDHIDVNGWFITNGGTINVYGGVTNSYLGYNGLGGFDMNGGVIDFVDKSITIQTVVDEFTFNIDGGGILRIGGSFYDQRGDVTFAEGTLEMYGSTSNTISLYTGSYLDNLVIGKNGTNFVAAMSDVTLNGTLTVENGVFNTNGKIIKVGSNVDVYSKITLSAGSQVKVGANKNLTVYDGGFLEMVGTAMTPAYVTRISTGYYGFNIEAGATIGAQYAVFEYMNASGVNIKPGAIVNSSYPMHYCMYQNGITGGTLLTVNNAQTLTMNMAYFYSGVSLYNVTKTNNQGTVHFTSPNGNFFGSNHENDPDSRIFWGTDLERVPTPVITYDENQNQIWLDWVYPVSCDYFKIMGSDSPSGPFNQVGTSTTTSWHHTVPGPYKFYQVKAIRN